MGFTDDGYEVIDDAVPASRCEALLRELAHVGTLTEPRTLLQRPCCRELAETLMQMPRIRAHLPANPRAVLCTLFEKSADHNWLVAWHQDLCIPVARRVGDPRCGGWSSKDGLLHTQPPAEILQCLVAARVHLDPCGPEDGALRVVPGSHRHGRLDAARSRALRGQGEAVCVLGRGGVLLLRPLLLHASSKSAGRGRRRVLHFLFGPGTLPLGLEWPDEATAGRT